MGNCADRELHRHQRQTEVRQKVRDVQHPAHQQTNAIVGIEIRLRHSLHDLIFVPKTDAYKQAAKRFYYFF